MVFEHVFTSVPKGLKPGTRGFSSVAYTEGMPANYVQFCESISGYAHVFTPEDTNYTRNPPAFSHLMPTLGGRLFSVLSRVGSCGIDYTGRSNKLAHHVLASPEDRPSAGPAVIMRHGDLFMEQWNGQPRLLPPGKTLMDHSIASFRAEHWERMLGEPEGAGILAQSFLDAPTKPSFILFEPGMDILPLIAEAQALLPPDRRWGMTFSTYYTTLPVGLECAWRCCLPDADALKVARRTPGVLVIDLINKRINGPVPADKRLILAAQTGHAPVADAPTKPRAGSGSAVLAQRPCSPADRQPQRFLRAQIPIDYSDALRPRPPVKTAPAGVPMWAAIAGIGALLLLVLSFALWRSCRGPGAAPDSQSVATNVQAQAANEIVPAMKPIPATTGLKGESVVEAIVGRASAEEKEEQTNATNTLPTTNAVTSAVEHSKPPVRLFDVLKHAAAIEFDPSVDVKNNGITFFDFSGSELKANHKPGGLPTDPGRLVWEKKELARIDEKERRLFQLHGNVQLVRITTGNTNWLHLVSPLTGTVVEVESNREYRIHFPDTGVAREIIACLKAQQGQLAMHGKRVTTEVVFRDVNVGLESDCSVLGREPEDNCWSSEDKEADNRIRELAIKINKLESLGNWLCESTNVISKARDAWQEAKNQPKPKDAEALKKRDNNIKLKENAFRLEIQAVLRKCLKDDVVLFPNANNSNPLKVAKENALNEAEQTDKKLTNIKMIQERYAKNPVDLLSEWIMSDSVVPGGGGVGQTVLNPVGTEVIDNLQRVINDNESERKKKEKDKNANELKARNLRSADVTISVLWNKNMIISGTMRQGGR